MSRTRRRIIEADDSNRVSSAYRRSRRHQWRQNIEDEDIKFVRLKTASR